MRIKQQLSTTLGIPGGCETRLDTGICYLSIIIVNYGPIRQNRPLWPIMPDFNDAGVVYIRPNLWLLFSATFDLFDDLSRKQLK